MDVKDNRIIWRQEKEEKKTEWEGKSKEGRG